MLNMKLSKDIWGEIGNLKIRQFENLKMRVLFNTQ